MIPGDNTDTLLSGQAFISEQLMKMPSSKCKESANDVVRSQLSSWGRLGSSAQTWRQPLTPLGILSPPN